MTENSDTSCAIEGAQYLYSDDTSEELCARFRQRLVAGLGVENAPDLQVSLRIDKSGTLDALVSLDGRSYPMVSVDVMDRALNAGDLDHLADSVVGVVKTVE